MNTEIKNRWVAALRSDEYQQTRGALRVTEDTADHAHPVGFCCLGVLCDLAVQDGVVPGWVTDEASGGYEGIDDDGGVETGIPPYHVSLWAGLHDRNPLVGGDTLSSANDRGRTFAEIADLIERYL